MTHTLASVSVSQSVQNLLNTVAHSLPKIAVFLLVMIVGWIIATVVRRVVQALLHKLNFDRVAERGAIGPALASRGYSASSLLARLVYYAVLLVTLQLAFGVFGPNPVSTMLNGMVSWLPKAFVAIILVVVASAIAKVVKDLLGAALGGLSYGRFVASTAGVVIIALGVIAALNQIDVAASVTTPVLIAVLATVGAILAIGIGGGMVRPMEQRWERMLGAAERETSSLAAYQRGRQDALSSPATLAGPGTGREAGVYAGHSEYASPQPGGYAGPETGGHAGPEPGGYATPQGGGYPGPEPAGYGGPEPAGYGGPEPGGYAGPEPGGYAGPEPGRQQPYPPQGPGMPPPPQHHGMPDPQ
jgi:Conserved TM helix